MALRLSALIDLAAAQSSEATKIAVLAAFAAADQLNVRAETLLAWARS